MSCWQRFFPACQCREAAIYRTGVICRQMTEDFVAVFRMDAKFRVITVACLGLTLALPFGVSAEEELEETSVPAESSESQPSAVIDMILASVDGEPLTFSDLQRYIRSKGGTPPEDIQSGDFEIRKQLRELVLRDLLTKEAKETGITVADDEISAYVEEIKRENDVDDAGFEELLQGRGLTLEEYYSQVRSDIVRARVISASVRSKFSVSDEDVLRYLDSRPELRPEKGMLHLHQASVLFRNSPEMSEEECYHAIQKIRESSVAGQDFREAAGQYYEDLGYLRVEDLREELQRAVEGLEVGEVSPIVTTDRGYLLLSVASQSSEDQPIDDTLKAQIRDEIYQTRFKEQVDKFLNEELPKKYHVELKL